MVDLNRNMPGVRFIQNAASGLTDRCSTTIQGQWQTNGAFQTFSWSLLMRQLCHCFPFALHIQISRLQSFFIFSGFGGRFSQSWRPPACTVCVSLEDVDAPDITRFAQGLVSIFQDRHILCLLGSGPKVTALCPIILRFLAQTRQVGSGDDLNFASQAILRLIHIFHCPVVHPNLGLCLAIVGASEQDLIRDFALLVYMCRLRQLSMN